MTAKVNPFSIELFRNSLASLADEMALTIYRTAYSSVVKESMDFSTAICDARGRMVAQGLTLPMHLGAIPAALNAVIQRYRNNIEQGDVFILNDPFDGGAHLPDIFLFKPIFSGKRLVAFACTICHHTDVGGRVAGSNASDSTEVYQEGLRIPPLKLFQVGLPNESIWRIIEKNVRVPTLVRGDIRAQLAACHTAESGLLDLVRHYGQRGTVALMSEIVDRSEKLARAAIRDFPEGVYEFEDFLDDDGIDLEHPIRLKVTVEKRGDGLIVDWTGSASQVRGALNCTLSHTCAAVYTAVKCVLPDDIPANEGLFRAIKVIAPVGTICNAVLPAATAARGLTGFRLVDCCFGALAKMIPNSVGAASDGGNVALTIGGYRADRSPFIYVDFYSGGWGGRPWSDGLQGNAHLCSNNASTSVEVTEREQPIQIVRYEFIGDAMGHGKYRGGAPFRREYRMREDEGTLQLRNDRCVFRPYGLAGGTAGSPARNILNPGPNEQSLPGKVTRTFKKGETICYEMAGAGGWGDPLERDPRRVLADVRNGFLTEPIAWNVYGVQINRNGWSVDAAATGRRRAYLRRERGSLSPQDQVWAEGHLQPRTSIWDSPAGVKR